MCKIYVWRNSIFIGITVCLTCKDIAVSSVCQDELNSIMTCVGIVRFHTRMGNVRMTGGLLLSKGWWKPRAGMDMLVTEAGFSWKQYGCLNAIITPHVFVLNVRISKALNILGNMANILQTTHKTEGRHDSKFVVIGGRGGCHYDNLRYRLWRHGWHHDNSRVYA